MNFDEFTGQVQHRLELASTGEAVRATRAVLTTIGERIQAGEAADLASSLPMEIDRFVTEADSGQRFSMDEFVDRVAERAAVDRPDAFYYAQTVMAVTAETVPESELLQVKGQLPEEFDRLFEYVE